EAAILVRLQALERDIQLFRHLDVVGEPDYALWSAGGRIVRQLTSETYIPDLAWWMRPWNSQIIVPRPPEVALAPDIQAGSCWPMRKNHGSLGVRLAEEIVPHAITIDHLAMQLSFRNDTAPRGIEIWGLQARGRAQKTGTLPDFVLLGHLTYDIHAPLPVQTFNLSREVTELHLGMETLLFILEDNWGNDAYTCIYRVRVHG
ncbi:UNC-like C-terminal-domain-containing protein, partial [Cerioporus squamosus]